MEIKQLTTAAGAPVANNQNILTVGKHGPMLMENLWFLEKITHFDREVIPERRMHAKGSGAFGSFTVTHDITRYTKADLFSEVGKQTPVFMRFSTVAGERGAADAERDIRGFAMRFYTQQGNWDLVGNNTPVFFLRDPLKFPDLNHAIKRDPLTGLRSPQNNWDFWAHSPEALHQVTITMSDRGIPASFRHMHGFGSHTFSMYDCNNNRVWVKFHFRTCQGIKNLSDLEAARVIAADRDSNARDLFESIQKGNFPSWILYIQVMTEEQAKAHRDNPFDITKVWSKKQYPLIEVGKLTLNRNPDNFFAQVEQAAFNPAHIVPGIGISPDKLLQGRLLSYQDAQHYRIGVNHHLIPVNQPVVPQNSYHRDGKMRVDGNYGATTSYVPNRYGQWAEQKQYDMPPYEVCGMADNYNPLCDKEDDVYYQPGDLYRLMTEDKKRLLIENTVRSISPVTADIKCLHIKNCYLADRDYGTRLANALGIDLRKAIG